MQFARGEGREPDQQQGDDGGAQPAEVYCDPGDNAIRVPADAGCNENRLESEYAKQEGIKPVLYAVYQP